MTIKQYQITAIPDIMNVKLTSSNILFIFTQHKI